MVRTTRVPSWTLQNTLAAQLPPSCIATRLPDYDRCLHRVASVVATGRITLGDVLFATTRFLLIFFGSGQNPHHVNSSFMCSEFPLLSAMNRVVRTAGVEPARGLPLRILSPVCLPVPPRPRTARCARYGARNLGPRERRPRHVGLTAPARGRATDRARANSTHSELIN
jgi:hypothetical protein